MENLGSIINDDKHIQRLVDLKISIMNSSSIVAIYKDDDDEFIIDYPECVKQKLEQCDEEIALRIKTLKNLI